MPIRHMAQSLTEIPDHAVNVQDVTDSYINQVHFGEQPLTPEAAERKRTWKLYCYDTHVGVCLFEREYNGYHDSDFYMVFWNEETQQPDSYMFGTTRGWCGPAMGSSPDATPEIWAKYNAYQARLRKEAEERRAAIEAKTPRHGKTVKVVRGIKIPIGTIGDVFWTGDVQSPDTGRIGIRLLDGTRVFTATKNVEVI